MVTFFSYDDALQILDTLISRDETNAAPRKRRITIFMERGRNVEAIKELTEYLKMYFFSLNNSIALFKYFII